MILEHLLTMAGEQALHKAYNAWKAASVTEDMQEVFRTAWELHEKIRLSKLFDASNPNALAADEIASVLEDLRTYRSGYSAVAKKYPAQFDAAMQCIAKYDYELRNPTSKYRGNTGLHIVSLQLKANFEAIGIRNIHEVAKSKRQSK